MPGPAPKPAALRKRTNAVPGTVYLPPAGRPGRPPRWPLEGKAPRVWAKLWATPQAHAWELLAMERVVARYAVILTRSEEWDAQAAILSECRQLEDRLGLTPMALLRLRWEIDRRDEAADRPSPGSVIRLA